MVNTGIDLASGEDFTTIGGIRLFKVGDTVKITDSMARDWIGRKAIITKVISCNPICYELNIGGGHWLHSTLEKS
jgi:hypothetical protein